MSPAKDLRLPLLLLACLILCPGIFLPSPARAWQGMAPNGTAITQADLEDMLKSHYAYTFDSPKKGRRVELDGANLNGVDLSHRNLIGASLKGANFTHASCVQADFSKADLSGADFTGADLTRTDFSKATLWNVNFQGANCTRTVFYRADLNDADFSGATMRQTILNGAKLTGATFFDTLFECRYLPDIDYLGGIRGLATTRATRDTLSGLIRFRQAFRDAGLQESEREVTYAIERVQAAAAAWPERWFKTLLFNWTCGYGMYPGRPLWILLGLFLAFIPVYWVALWPNDPRRRRPGGPCAPEGAPPPIPGPPRAGHAAAAGACAALTFIATYLGAYGLPGLREEGAGFLAAGTVLLVLYYLLAMRRGWAGCRPRQVRALRRLQRGARPGAAAQAPFSAMSCAAPLALLSAALFLASLHFDRGSPTRADVLAAAVFFCLVLPPFWLAAVQGECRDGIYRTWSADRVRTDLGKDGPELLPWPGLKAMSAAAVGWAAYFSLLSTFNLGFREFNVGNWIARVQPQEYTLKATGWVRVVSGVQSLVCIYLLALWVLTYFGRPFD